MCEKCTADALLWHDACTKAAGTLLACRTSLTEKQAQQARVVKASQGTDEAQSESQASWFMRKRAPRPPRPPRTSRKVCLKPVERMEDGAPATPDHETHAACPAARGRHEQHANLESSSQESTGKRLARSRVQVAFSP